MPYSPNIRAYPTFAQCSLLIAGSIIEAYSNKQAKLIDNKLTDKKGEFHERPARERRESNKGMGPICAYFSLVTGGPDDHQLSIW